MPRSSDPTDTTVALFDGRPFFEKALRWGVQQGLIGADKLATMRTEGAKGIVQIARYFGTEYLRPDLELACTRLVNLVSLHLEDSCGGDLQRAAEALRDHSLLSRSKAGSDLLKALIAMPQSTHFALHERPGFRDEHIPLLAKWSLRPLAEVRAERARRAQAEATVAAARWLAAEHGLDPVDLEDSDKDAESVIRTALLCDLCRVRAMPDWPSFEKMVLALRRRRAGRQGAADTPPIIAPPRGLPAACRDVVQMHCDAVQQDLPRILDPRLAVRQLFDQTPAFLGRYYWIEDALAEIEHVERTRTAVWDKATGGHPDDAALLTLFLRIATGAAHTTVLTEAMARTLIRKTRKAGLDTEAPRQFIRRHAPPEHQADHLQLWDQFVQDAERVLRSDAVHGLQDALALLRRDCHVARDARGG